MFKWDTSFTYNPTNICVLSDLISLTEVLDAMKKNLIKKSLLKIINLFFDKY